MALNFLYFETKADLDQAAFTQELQTAFIENDFIDWTQTQQWDQGLAFQIQFNGETLVAALSFENQPDKKRTGGMLKVLQVVKKFLFLKTEVELSEDHPSIPAIIKVLKSLPACKHVELIKKS